MFFEADEALVADDDVVDQLDVQNAARRHELLRRLDILRQGRRVATRMVVAEDQAGHLRRMAGRKTSAVRSTELVAVPW